MIIRPSVRICLFLLAFIASAAILYFSGIRDWLTLDMLKTHKEFLKLFVDYHPFQAPLIYISIFTIMLMCVIPLTPLFTVAAGFLFGGFLGGFYTLVAGSLGAVALMLVVRYLLRERIAAQKNAKFEKFQRELHKYGGRYLLSLTFLPITPFGVIATLAGLSDISMLKFALVIFIGMIPGTFIYSYAGQKLSELESVGQIMSPLFIGLFALMGLMALLPIIMLKYKEHKSKA